MSAASPLLVAAFSTNAWDSALAMLRITGPWQACGAQVVAGCEGEQVFPERVSQAALVVIQRDFPRHVDAYRSIVERARAERKRIVYDLDDLLFELPEDHPDRHSRYYDSALLPMLQAMVEADGVTVSTPALATYCRAYNPHTWVLPNYLNDRLWPMQPRPAEPPGPPAGSPVTIGYMGGNSHAPDLQAIQPVIRSIARKYGDRVQFRFWGIQPPMDIAADVGVKRLDWAPLDQRDYARFAAAFSRAQCDIFLAPLRDNLFNQCKSCIKFLEYSALGIPGIYSRCLPYEAVVVHGENGLLAGRPEEWEGCLCRLIESPEMRRELGANARTTVQRNWLLSNHASEWTDLYRRVTSPEFQPAGNAVAFRVAQQAIDWQRRGGDGADNAATTQEEILRMRNAELARQVAERDALIQGYQNGRVMRAMTGAQVWLNKLTGRGPTARPSVPASTAHEPTASPPGEGADDSRQADRYKQLLSRLYLGGLESFLASGRRLALPGSAQPEVTIILILYNRAELTLQCLRSLADGLSKPCQVLIVDNASTDGTGALLSRLDGATVIRNETNRGYLLACNQAAWAARGEVLLFLNNDAQVLPGAIDSALSALRSAGDVGAAGGKIILLDGSLQEAGSIVWSDGSCAGYGRGDAPSRPAYNFARDVDYCSGAFLLTRRDLFLQLGGFDETFQPAYYEDSDYCLRLWQTGWRTVYDPGATVLHYEFGSSPSGDSRAAAQLQVEHQRILARKHADWLAGKRQPHPSNLLWARTARTGATRVLFVDDRVPHADIGSGSPRAKELLLGLLEAHCEVTLYPLKIPSEPWDQVYRDIPRTVEVMIDYGRPMLEAFLAERRAYYDVIVASRPHNFFPLREIAGRHPDWFAHTRVVYDAEAIYADRDVAERQLKGETVPDEEWRNLVQQEVSLARGADAVIGVSDAECARFVEQGHKRVYKLGHALDPAPTPNPFEARSGLLFVGGIYGDRTPNADAVAWFIQEILPRIRQALGESVTFTVAGANEFAGLRALAGGEVHFAGRVEDLVPLYNQARVFVAPTRFAAGIPWKVHEAAAHGLPVVATPLLASQLGWRDGRELLVAGDAASFAAQCARLYTDRRLWETLCSNALGRVGIDCSREAFQKTINEMLRF